MLLVVLPVALVGIPVGVAVDAETVLGLAQTGALVVVAVGEVDDLLLVVVVLEVGHIVIYNLIFIRYL